MGASGREPVRETEAERRGMAKLMARPTGAP